MTWRAGVSPARAAALVKMARRRAELPECWALFESGALTEDAMREIARHVPAGRDAEMASLAPLLLHSQLRSITRSLPEQTTPAEPPKPEPERQVAFGFRDDGSWGLHAVLPADEGAVVQQALGACPRRRVPRPAGQRRGQPGRLGRRAGADR